MRRFGIFLFLILSVLCVECGDVRWDREDDLAAQSWQKTQSWTKYWIDERLKYLMPAVEHMDTSSECFKHVKMVTRELQNLTPWAVKMLDSWAKLPTGVTSGLSGFNGDYDLCLSVEPETKDFKGKYCNLAAKVPVPGNDLVHKLTINSRFSDFAGSTFTNETIVRDYVRENMVWYYRYALKFGICVPSSCSVENVAGLAQNVLIDLQWNISVADCQTQEANDVNVLQGIVLGIFVALLATVCVATYLDTKRNDSPPTGWANHFSLVRNWDSLTGNQKGKKSHYPYLDGIRVVLGHWTILLHTFSMFQPAALVGTFWSAELVKQPIFQLVMNAWVTVDTFFCITGYLLAFSLMKSLEESRGETKPFTLVIRRFLRFFSNNIVSIAGRKTK